MANFYTTPPSKNAYQYLPKDFMRADMASERHKYSRPSIRSGKMQHGRQFTDEQFQAAMQAAVAGSDRPRDSIIDLSLPAASLRGSPVHERNNPGAYRREQNTFTRPFEDFVLPDDEYMQDMIPIPQGGGGARLMSAPVPRGQSVEDFLAKHPPQGTISARTPTANERLRYGLNTALFGDTALGQEKADRLANLLNFTPVGVATGAYDVGKAAAEGDPLSLGITAAAAALPRAIAKPAASSTRQVVDFLRDKSGMFLGPKAKKADLSKLSQAQLLEQNRAGRDEILEKTGWFKGPDKKWRFEIDDSQSKFSMPRQSVSQLGFALQHKELFDNYPELAKTRLEVENSADYAAAFDPMNRNIYLAKRQDTPSAHSAILHETQHAVQDIEGFAKGAAPGIQDTVVKGSTAHQALQEIEARMVQPMSIDDLRPHFPNASDAELQQIKMTRDARLKRPLTAQEKVVALEHAGREGYDRSAGEVEARNTQSRMKFDPATRRQVAPWLTQDRDDVLVDRSNFFNNLLGKLMR